MRKVLFVVFSLVAYASSASVKEYVASYSSTQTNNFLTSTSTSQSFTISDPFQGLGTNCFYNQSSDLTVKLKMVHPGDAASLATNTTIYSVPIKIELWSYWNTGTTPSKTYTTTLEIKYDETKPDNTNTLISVFHTENFYKAKITRNTSGAIPNPHNAKIDFSAVLSVKRAFKLDRIYVDFTTSKNPSFNPTNTSFDNQKGDALKITTDNKYNFPIAIPCLSGGNGNDVVQDETDIEWVFIDKNSPNGTFLSTNAGLSSTQLKDLADDLTFSRVSLPPTTKTFEIPLIYGEGYIFIRTRPVTYLGERRIEGEWYYYDNFRSQTNGLSSIYYHLGHQKNLNWTSAITFAEEAKTKESISYFDGTQRERQSVTINNSENIALITESLYDFEGRKAISTLPAPKLSNVSAPTGLLNLNGTPVTYTKSIPSNTIKFYDGFSLNIVGENYKEKNFNMHPDPITGCSIIPTDPMSTSTGAAHYYSPNNKMYMTHSGTTSELKNEYLYKWVPDAEKYPFVQTRYTTDGTNRVALQSGLGPDYKLGSNRAIQYFYTNVNSQNELKKLFGPNVGNKQYYTKTFSSDPNGQTTVSYKDAKDRVIATALIGDTPAGLQALPGSVQNETYHFIETDRLSKDYETLTLEGTASHFIPMDNENMNFTIDFDHTLRTDDYETELCTPSDLYCADCFYDIDFRATDKCGIELINESLKNYDDNTPINLSCDNNAPSPLPSVVRNISLSGLNKGGIDMHATVKVSETHADLYTEKYIEELKKCDEYKLETFIQKNVELIDEFDCIKTCEECQTLLAKPLSDFEAKIVKQHKGLVETGQITASEITSLANQMKADLQEKCDAMCGNDYLVECMHYKESMLRDVSWGGQYCFQLDANGEVDLTSDDPNVAYAILNNPIFKDADGNNYTDINKVIEDWKMEWAEDLIKYHPEYCYYEQCVKTQNANKFFNDMMDDETSYDGTVHNRVNTNYYVSNEYMYDPVSISLPPSGSPQSNSNLTAYINGANTYKFFSDKNVPDAKPIKEYAFKMAFSQHQGYNESGTGKYSPAHFFSGTNYTEYCKEDLALFWQMYKSLLTSYRDVMRFKNLEPSGMTCPIIGSSSSINTYCCPNQYISCGSGGKSATEDRIQIQLNNKDLFDGFTYTPTCVNEDASGNPYVVMHFSGGKTYTRADFNGKQRIFPDYKTTMEGFIDKMNTIVGTHTSVSSNPTLTAEQENAKKITCEYSAEGWMEDFKECINNLSLSQTQRDELKENLIKVCAKHAGDPPYFSGTKSIDPDPQVTGVDITVGSNNYTNIKSFQEVLDKYRGSTSTDPYCNADLVSNIPYYGTGPSKDQATQREIFAPQDESCECDMVHMWKERWEDASSGLTFYNYMASMDATFNKITEEQLNTLISGCEGTQVACRYMGAFFELPYSFQCTKYYTCFELELLKDKFDEKYDGTNWSWYPESAYQEAFTGYFNSQKGMNLHYEDYTKFDEECDECIEDDFVANRKKYQDLYDQAMTYFRSGGKKFPYFKNDNLRMLAKYFNDNLSPAPTDPIDDLKMIEILCKYYINTDGDFPCCVLDLYDEFVDERGEVADYDKSTYRYYQLMRVYINENGGYKLSINDYKAILNNCGDIDVEPDYNCCDLHIRWMEYSQMEEDEKTYDKTRCEYLNWVFGQDENCNKINDEYTRKYNLCMTTQGNFDNCEDATVISNCLPSYQQVFVEYKNYLLANPSFVINWDDNTNIQIIADYVNQQIGTSYTPVTIKAVLTNPDCHPICVQYKKIIDHYIDVWLSQHYIANVSQVSISELTDLLNYLKLKIENRTNTIAINDFMNCTDLSILCDRIGTIHTKYMDYLALNSNLNASWTTIQQSSVAYINQTVSPPISVADLQLIYSDYRECLGFDKCAVIATITNRYKAKYNIVNNFIPPTQLDQYQSYIRQLSYSDLYISDVEGCGTNFCTMYKPVYDRYKAYLDGNVQAVIDWDDASDAFSVAAINSINATPDPDITLDDLRKIFNNFRYKCGWEPNKCTELTYYFNRFLNKEGKTFAQLSPNKYKEIVDDLNSYYDTDHPSSYWTKKLKDANCLGINFCLAYDNIFNAYVLYHQNNSTFEVNWTSLQSSLLTSVKTTTGYTDLIAETIKEAFNNSECSDKYICTLLGHYYTAFKVNPSNGNTIASSSNNSLTSLTAYFNDKFLSDLTFKEWLTKWKACTVSKDVENYIIPCSTIRESIVNLLIQNPTQNFDNIISGNLSADDVSTLNSNSNIPSGRLYIALDWELLFSLCTFDKHCIILEVEVAKANAVGANINDCNLNDFLTNIGSILPSRYKCSLNDFESCNIDPPFGIGNINHLDLTTEIANFMYKLEDPFSHYDQATNTFKKGAYLDALRNHLNTHFSVTLSLCDYSTLLEIWEGCCYYDFFNKIDYEFIMNIYNQKYINSQPPQQRPSYRPMAISQEMYDDNVLYCTKAALNKYNKSIDPTIKKYVQWGNGQVPYSFHGNSNNPVSGYDFEVLKNIISPVPNINIVDPSSSMLPHYIVDVNTGNSICGSKFPCVKPPKKMKKPKCDISDCASFVASYNGATDGRIFDRNTDFEEWWDAVYWEMTEDLFGDGEYMTKEELMKKLLCCGIDIYDHKVPQCDEEFRRKYEEFLNSFASGYSPGPEEIRDFLNSEYGVDATAAYWMTKLSVSPCNLIDPDGNDDCTFFKNNFEYALFNSPKMVGSQGFLNDVLDIINEDYNMTAHDLIQKISQCFNCLEIAMMFNNSVDFRNLIKELCSTCTTDYDLKAFTRSSFNCADFPYLNDCYNFQTKFFSVLQTSNGNLTTIINGLKPEYDFTAQELMDKLKDCLECSGLKQFLTTDQNFQSMMMQHFGTNSMTQLKLAMEAEFGCDFSDEGGSLYERVIPPYELETTYATVNSTNNRAKYSFKSRKISVNPFEEVVAKVEVRKQRRIEKFESRLSETSFADVRTDKLIASNDLFASAASAAPPGGAPSTKEYSFNAILGLDIEFDDYGCCSYCDKRLYDKPLFPLPPEEPDPCEYLTGLAITNAISEYNKVIQKKAEEYKKNYLKKCMDAAKLTISATANDRQHHYTLYYYDQVGNLIQTVPPKGVRFYDNANSNTTDNPQHRLLTQYKYNMDNQVVEQESPDGGKSIFIYDELGRLILSQNAKQFPNSFSYSKYDNLNRITESGEIIDDNTYTGNVLYQATPMGINNQPLSSFYFPNDNNRMSYCNFEQYMEYNHSNSQTEYSYVTRTYYDNINDMTLLAPMDGSAGHQTVMLENIHNRIAATTLDAVDGDKSDATYSSALLYDYDIVGNVKRLYTYNGDKSIADLYERLKTVDYDYDVHSGKVTKVYYQKDKGDQYIHKYGYDANNRLTDVHTSFDDKIFNREARYTYYLHGPLARIEMGEHKVQGLDYVYTIQGWLKSVNGSTLDHNNEPGQDGRDLEFLTNTCAQLPQSIGNSFPASPGYRGVARDAVAFSLDYNQNDYKAIRGGANSGNITPKLSTKNLYNGNIVSMKVSNRALENTAAGQTATMGFDYTYDQLHRIVAMDAFKGVANTATQDYKTTYSYDANGNIQTLTRNMDNHTGTSPSMDDLGYGYYHKNSSGQLFLGIPGPTDKLTNQLATVSDPVMQSNYDLDIDNMFNTKFKYDEIGNLIEDEQEMMGITWTPTGKIAEILINNTNTNTFKTISFAYDPMGQRISKMVNDASGLKYTYYRRDAQGNLIATNNNVGSGVGDGGTAPTYSLGQYVVYGSSRLGVKAPKKYSNPINYLPVSFPNDPILLNPTWQSNVIFNPTYSTNVGDNYEEEVYSESSYSFGGLLGPFMPQARLLRFKSTMTQYEIANHLGNVLATLKDEVWYNKKSSGSGYNHCVWTESMPMTLTATDYYPFGMTMPGRTYAATGTDRYRFGFNTQEKDDEIYGKGNMTTAKYWQYDARIGRRWNTDPVVKLWESPYLVNNGNPIWVSDPMGDDGKKRAEKYQKKHGGLVYAGKNKATVRSNIRTVKDGDKKYRLTYDETTFKDNAFEKFGKAIAKFFSKNWQGEGGEQRAGVPLTKKGSTVSPTKQTAQIIHPPITDADLLWGTLSGFKTKSYKFAYTTPTTLEDVKKVVKAFKTGHSFGKKIIFNKKFSPLGHVSTSVDTEKRIKQANREVMRKDKEWVPDSCQKCKKPIKEGQDEHFNKHRNDNTSTTIRDGYFRYR